LANARVPNRSLRKLGPPRPLFGSAATVFPCNTETESTDLYCQTFKVPDIWLLGFRCSFPVTGVLPALCSTGSRPAAPCEASVQEPVSQSPDSERSLCSKVIFMCFVSVPRARGNYKLHQLEPRYLVRLHYSGGSPDITEGAV
jgi:hypothetical protein